MTPLLEVDNLHVVFDTDRGAVRAVNGVSFAVQPGETLGLVGESGCGKTMTAQAILRLIPSPPGRIAGGRILFDGEDVLLARPERLRRLRGAAIGMIFQEPLSALNPVLSVGTQLTELLTAHGSVSRTAMRQQALETLSEVGLPDPPALLRAYPHQLSGGMRQRVVIAMAIALRPRLVIADEPTTALDVTVQAQIITLFKQLKARHHMTLLLISHDVGVMVQLADRIAVLYAGHVVEEAPTATLFTAPRHPYTRGLLAAIPARRAPGELPEAIPGAVPDAAQLPSGCPFHPRCPRVLEVCRGTFPEMTVFDPAHRAACYNPEPIVNDVNDVKDGKDG